MTRVVPTLLGVTTFPEIVATPGRDEVKIHVPGEVEVGTFKLNEVTLSREIVTSENGPTVGLRAVISKVLVVVALVYVLVANCVALMVIVPASNKVTMFPFIVATVYPLRTLLDRE